MILASNRDSHKHMLAPKVRGIIMQNPTTELNKCMLSYKQQEESRYTITEQLYASIKNKIKIMMQDPTTELNKCMPA